MAAPKQSLYEILGIPRDANELDVGLAFQRRMLELQRASPQDPSQIAYVTQAHEVLSNPARRAAYDASLLTAQERAAAAAQSRSGSRSRSSRERSSPPATAFPPDRSSSCARARSRARPHSPSTTSSSTCASCRSRDSARSRSPSPPTMPRRATRYSPSAP